MLLWINLGVDIAIAVVLLAIFVLFTIFTNKSMKKFETIPKGFIWLYVLDVLYLFAAVTFILWMFEYDFQTSLTDMWASVQDTVLAKVGALIGTAITIILTMVILRVSAIIIRRTGEKAKNNKT